MKKKRVLITSANSSCGLSIIKGLLDDPRVELVLADSERLGSAFALYPRMPRYRAPNGTDSRFIGQVMNVCRKEKIDAIFPVSDSEVYQFTKKKKYFDARGILLLASKYGAVKTALNKYECCRLCDKLSIPFPRTTLVKNSRQLKQVERRNIQFPMLVKPNTGDGASHVRILHDMAELRFYAKDLLKKKIPILLQSYVPGGSGSIYLYAAFFDAGGRSLSEFCSRSLRTKFSFGGPGVAGEPIYDNVVTRQGRALLNEIGGWRGPVNVEFKKNEKTGEYVFLEINPRYWGYSFLSTAIGMNFPKATVDSLVFGLKTENFSRYDTDVILVRTQNDLVLPKSLMEISDCS